MNHHLLLVIHLLAATIWVGGHIYICIAVLPRALKKKDAQVLLAFEKTYEPIGMLSLLLLVITGIWMTVQFGIGWSQLFSFQTPIEKLVFTKLALLLATIALAISAQVRVIPSFKQNSNRLPEMAVHAAAVTIIGISMLVIGSFGRYGGI